MTPVEAIFWLLGALVVYTYVGYPLILLAFGSRPIRRVGGSDRTPSVTVILAARNEQGVLERRLSELMSLVRSSGCTGEVIVVSDGSSDGTASLARQVLGTEGRVIELPRSGGKAA